MTENILKCPLVYLASDEIQLKIQQGKSIFDFPCSEFPYLPRKKSWNSKKKKKIIRCSSLPHFYAYPGVW